MTDAERLAALEARVTSLEDLVRRSNLWMHVPMGPVQPIRHPQISWACKHPRPEDKDKHNCSWRSCGCGCHGTAQGGPQK